MHVDLSKAVTDRLRACLVVRSAYLKWGGEVAAALLAVVRQHLEQGDEEPDFAAARSANGDDAVAVASKSVAQSLKTSSGLSVPSSRFAQVSS